ncbi:MAG TPA: response regulator transcription factor [Thermomicrobiaceae bacterium]|nr:response regulator transcription factor [Thermomicrobiaceae bacterium]
MRADVAEIVEEMARILVVDDDPNIRQVVRFALGDEGHQVEEASDGRAALEQADRFHPDVILLDMKMPGMDGWEFARRYRARYGRRAATVVLTAAHDAGRRARDIGADGYVAKPFDLDVLFARVDEAARGAARRMTTTVRSPSTHTDPTPAEDSPPGSASHFAR